MRLILACALCTLFGVNPAQPASYDCKQAKVPTEIAICISDELSRDDEINAILFHMVRSGLTGDDRRLLLMFERQWLKQRNNCGADHQCLDQIYNGHIEQLLARLSWTERQAFCLTENGSFVDGCIEIRESNYDEDGSH